MYRVVYIAYVCCIPLFSYGLDIRIHAEKRERERERAGGVPLAFAMWDLQSSQSYDVVFVHICAILRMTFLVTDHIQVYIHAFRYV